MEPRIGITISEARDEARLIRCVERPVIGFPVKMRRCVSLLVLVCATLLFSLPALAQFLQQGPKLVGTGAEGNVYQGYSVSLSADGNTAIVGGQSDSPGGAAWVWMRSGGVWTQQGAKLVGSGAVGNAYQGQSVALSADGNTAIVGGPGDNNGAGAAWVWTRNGDVWTQQGNKLVGSGAVGRDGAKQGTSVALSADGNTAIIGGIYDNFIGGFNGNSIAGAAWVWTRSGDVWTQQGSKLVGSGAADFFGAQQGTSVSLSADGNTAIVGGYSDNKYAGAAWVWARSGGVWTQQGNKLVGSGAVGNAWQGGSVSLSADGNTAIVGGHSDNSGAGATWVWTRSGDVWTQQGPKLVGTGAEGDVYQGTSVSLSADGNTAIIGGHGASPAGAAWVWARIGGVWTQQGNKLVGSGAVKYPAHGYSVSLSGDGNTAIVGGPNDNGLTGAAWVWTRSAGVWSQQGAKLVGSGAEGKAAQGQSVALSADGNTAIVGGWKDNSTIGAAWIWTRNGGVWTQQGTKLVGSDAEGITRQGFSVSLSADGNTAVVGASGFPPSFFGAAWVWTRSRGVWTQQGTKLVGSDAVGNALQGSSVSLSADGNTVIIGGSEDNNGAGAAWIWTRNGGVWTQQGNKLVGSGAVGNAYQGHSVSLSADGNMAIIGGPGDNSNTGTAWVWTRSGGVWTQHETKLVGSGGARSGAQGYSVSLSADGTTAIVGGTVDNAVRIWMRSGDVWTQQGAKLVSSGAMWDLYQGSSVALSADGKTAIVGGPGDNAYTGAAWVFSALGPTITALRTGNNLTLRWPDSATGYRVESALSLSPPMSWSNVTGTFQTTGGFISIVVPISDGQKFYRLAKP